MPTDYPRPAVESFRGARETIILAETLTNELKSLSQKESVTLFMVLLAALKTLLYRYTGQEDLLVGTPIANRTQIETENLIGCFLNTLVLRTDCSGDPSFRELLRRVRECTLAAYAHPDLPFEQLVKELQPERALSHTPLFQVMFVFQDAPMLAFDLPGLTLKQQIVDSGTAKFDLTIYLEDTNQGLVGFLEYNTDLFKADTITRMLEHFQTLLVGVVSNPEECISGLPLLTTTQMQQQLTKWNQTQADYSQNDCIHELFEIQVQRSPDAIAVVLSNEQLTYRELNLRANQLATHLRKLGVGPEVLVAICIERSVEMVVGLLGILKAGGAYVPLDPAYPKERLKFILEDTKATVLLTQRKLVEELPQQEVQVVCIDTDWEIIAQNSQENCKSGCTPTNLAYIIYTSGSTGQPKGVQINHGAVVNFLSTMRQTPGLTQEDILLSVTTLSFDIAALELYLPLIVGARVVIVSREVATDGIQLLKKLILSKATVMQATPATWRLLLGAGWSGTGQLKILCGGEALDRSLANQLLERSRQVWNLYGPTETTIWSAVQMVENKNNLEQTHNIVSIGRPIANTQFYILDQHQQLVPVGVKGELHIGGTGLARGYLNRPELTAQKFIPNPFQQESGERLYKTGDLVRLRLDGSIEYLGRIDHQVKIRGFRIELGEIEAMLVQHPAVRETVVVAHSTQTDDKHLVAYVVLHQQQTTNTTELRNYLKHQLPEYMVPSVFVMLESLPLTANGKLDRSALPALDFTRPELEQTFVAPRTPEEKTLAEIWAEILKIEQIGIHDNFFALGGDSIRSLKIRFQAKERGLNFSLQELFQHQTIYELTQNLTKSEVDTTKIELVSPFGLICEQDRLRLDNHIEDAYPLTKLQMGMLFHSKYNSDTATYHNVSSYHLQAPFNEQYFQTAVQLLAVRHPVLRTSFELNKFSEPLQLVHKVVNIPLQIEDLRHLSPIHQEEILTTWFETEKRSHFDWTQAPLLRFYIHRRSEETLQFSFTEHHAILDGWSVASMVTELFQHYFSLLNPEVQQIQLPPASSFRDFLALEQQAIASPECQRYWSEKLNDSTLTLLPRWPTKYRRETEQQVGMCEIPLSLEVSQGLKQLANSLGVPLKSVLLAAHLRILSLYSGQSDVVTGLVCNGRPEETDSERVLGVFLNTLPYRMQCQGGTWVDLVKKTFEAEQELLPFRRYPLAELQVVLGKQFLFETAFNFTNFHVYQDALKLKNFQVLDRKEYQRTNFTLVAHFNQDPSSSQIHLSLEYDSKELCKQQLKAIGDDYAKILTTIASEPFELYESYALLAAQSQHHLFGESISVQTDYSQNQCIHELFETQVEQTPDAIAVIFADQQLTYRELNIRANQLAKHLHSLGVGPELLVGICVERSLEMIVGILGTLKAGGAYVPLDPAYPKERLAFILQDTQLSVLLTQQQLLKVLPENQTRLVCIDTDWEIIAQNSQENPKSGCTPANLAYIIYTSGSTGQPKGVLINHANVNRLLAATQSWYEFNSSDVWTLFHSIAFDFSVWEIWGALLYGGRLVIVPYWLSRSPEEFYNLLCVQKVTVLNQTPSAFRQLIQAQQTVGMGKQLSLRLVIFGGEALELLCLKPWFENNGDQSPQLVNMYGITETTVHVTYRPLGLADLQVGSASVIGRPIPDMQIYILDPNQQPVPVGVPGEMYVGGVGLARGYLNRPQLTVDRFIPHPFEKAQGSKLYRTGDLARYLPDGDIEYLGRIRPASKDSWFPH